MALHAAPTFNDNAAGNSGNDRVVAVLGAALTDGKTYQLALSGIKDADGVFANGPVAKLLESELC